MPDKSAHAHTVRICHFCHEDCSHKPRLKDPEGHYWCKECFEKADALQRQRQAHAPSPAAPTPAGSPAPPPPAATAHADAAQWSDDGPLVLTEQEAGAQCIACKAAIPTDSTFCTLCGAAQRATGSMQKKPPKVRRSFAPSSKSQRISSAGEYGGFWARFVAFIIDSILISIVVVPVMFVTFFEDMTAAGEAQRSGAAVEPIDFPIWFWLLTYSITIGYGTLMEGLMGATLGKKALGLLVGSSSGDELGLLGALARNMAKSFISAPLSLVGVGGMIGAMAVGGAAGVVVGLVLLAIGVVPYLLNVCTPKRQALHDLCSGAMVVR